MFLLLWTEPGLFYFHFLMSGWDFFLPFNPLHSHSHPEVVNCRVTSLSWHFHSPCLSPIKYPTHSCIAPIVRNFINTHVHFKFFNSIWSIFPIFMYNTKETPLKVYSSQEARQGSLLQISLLSPALAMIQVFLLGITGQNFRWHESHSTQRSSISSREHMCFLSHFGLMAWKIKMSVF